MLSIDWTLYLYTLKYMHSDALYWLNSLNYVYVWKAPDDTKLSCVGIS